MELKKEGREREGGGEGELKLALRDAILALSGKNIHFSA